MSNELLFDLEIKTELTEPKSFKESKKLVINDFFKVINTNFDLLNKKSKDFDSVNFISSVQKIYSEHLPEEEFASLNQLIASIISDSMCPDSDLAKGIKKIDSLIMSSKNDIDKSNLVATLLIHFIYFGFILAQG